MAVAMRGVGGSGREKSQMPWGREGAHHLETSRNKFPSGDRKYDECMQRTTRQPHCRIKTPAPVHLRSHDSISSNQYHWDHKARNLFKEPQLYLFKSERCQTKLVNSIGFSNTLVSRANFKGIRGTQGNLVMTEIDTLTK